MNGLGASFGVMDGRQVNRRYVCAERETYEVTSKLLVRLSWLSFNDRKPRLPAQALKKVCLEMLGYGALMLLGDKTRFLFLFLYFVEIAFLWSVVLSRYMFYEERES